MSTDAPVSSSEGPEDSPAEEDAASDRESLSEAFAQEDPYEGGSFGDQSHKDRYTNDEDSSKDGPNEARGKKRREGIIDVAPETLMPTGPGEGSLSEGQEEAYRTVARRLCNGARHTALYGYAGTGKTFLTARLVGRLVDEDCEVHVCAPTHKASQVLREELKTDAPVSTLHSYLGLKLEPGQDGEYHLVPDEETVLNEGVVVVDEASMIGKEEWGYIEASPMWVQWLFVGDPAQLPPVNEETSPAMQVPGPTLEKVHRQAKDNPILALATDIRNRDVETVESAFEDGQGIGCTDDRESFIDSALGAFETDAFQENATHARVLAYRNKRVAWYNQEIRARKVGPDAERFVEGEWLVARETWVKDTMPCLTNSEEVRIRSTDTALRESEDQSEWKTWKLGVETPKEKDRKTIYVLHEDEQERYEKELQRRRDRAEEDPSKWRRFFDLKEEFAVVDYAYATTVHRSQGSTYDTAFVDLRDVRRRKGPEGRALLYVAVTRPAKRLGLLV